jgi:O-antigen/teichoic acid export membrane protein
LPIIKVVYGQGWLAAVPLVPWAMGWGFVAAFVHACYILLLAKNFVRLCFFSDIASLGLSCASLFLALPYGINTYLMATTGAQVLLACALLCVLTGKRIVRWSAVADAIIPPAMCSAFSALAVWRLHQALVSAHPTSFWPAMLWGGVFLVVFTILLRALFGRSLAKLVAYLPGGRVISKALLLTSA